MVTEPTFEPYPTTRALIDGLADRGRPLAIITDAWPSTRIKYEQLRFLDDIAIVISAEQGCTKPDERMFRPALDAIGVEPGDVLFIDDGPEIVAGARDLGFLAYRIDLDGDSGAPLTSHDDVLRLVDDLLRVRG